MISNTLYIDVIDVVISINLSGMLRKNCGIIWRSDISFQDCFLDCCIVRFDSSMHYAWFWCYEGLSMFQVVGIVVGFWLCDSITSEDEFWFGYTAYRNPLGIYLVFWDFCFQGCITPLYRESQIHFSAIFSILVVLTIFDVSFL